MGREEPVTPIQKSMSGEGHGQFGGQVRVVPEPGHGQSEMQYFSETQTFPTSSLPQSLLSILSPISEVLESHSESCWLCPSLTTFYCTGFKVSGLH
jgi:hypothetical protein